MSALHIASLLENRQARVDVPPSPSIFEDDSDDDGELPDSPSPYSTRFSNKAISPSVYSRADHASEYGFRPPPDEVPSPAPHEQAGDDNATASVPLEPEDDAEVNRMSVMAPKLKLLTKAPWELKEEDLLAYDESSDGMSIFGGRKGRSRSKTVTKEVGGRVWKGLGLVATRKSAHAPSASLPQTLSTASLHATLLFSPGNDSSKTRQSDLDEHDVWPAPTPSHSSSSNYIPPALSPLSERLPVFHGLPSPPSKRRHASKQRDPSPAPASLSHHPYANPAVYSPYQSTTHSSHTYAPLSPPPKFAHNTHKRSVNKSESSIVTKSSSTAMLYTPSNTTTFSLSPARSIATPHFTPSTSISSLPKSAPTTPGVDTAVEADGFGFPGSPTYNLITLEQARDRVRERSKSGGFTIGSKVISGPLPIISILGDNQQASSLTHQYNPHSLSASGGTISHASPTRSPRKPAPPAPAAVSSPLPPAIAPSVNSSTGAMTLVSSKDTTSHPLPPLPAQDASASHRVKTVKPKRSGFFSIFSKESRAEKERNGGMGPDFVPVPPTPRTALFAESAIFLPSGGSEMPSPLPPLPSHLQNPHLPLDQAHSETSSTTPVKELDLATSTTNAHPPSGETQLGVPRSSKNVSTTSLVSSIGGDVDTSRSSISVKSNRTSSSSKTNSRASKLKPLDLSIKPEKKPPSLQLRPVSSFFSTGLPLDLMMPSGSPISSSYGQSSTGSGGFGRINEVLEDGSATTPLSASTVYSVSTTNGREDDLLTPLSATSLPLSFPSNSPARPSVSTSSSMDSNAEPGLTAAQALALLHESRKKWRIQAWEYEGQIKELQQELAILRGTPRGFCESCGTELTTYKGVVIVGADAKLISKDGNTIPVSMLDRPKGKYGTGSMFSSSRDVTD